MMGDDGGSGGEGGVVEKVVVLYDGVGGVWCVCWKEKECEEV